MVGKRLIFELESFGVKNEMEKDEVRGSVVTG